MISHQYDPNERPQRKLRGHIRRIQLKDPNNENKISLLVVCHPYYF